MRKTLVLTLLTLLALAASAQIRIPDSKVVFTLPEGEWKYLQTTKVDKNTTVYLYSYMASNVIDSQGDTIIPHLKVYVRRNYQHSAIDLATDRWMQQPFQSLDEYTDGLPAPGIGYIGAYTNPLEKKDCVFRMIYFKEKNTAFEFRAETTADTYKQFDDMFEQIIRSVTIAK